MTTTPSDDELSSFLTLLARRLDIPDSDREWLKEAARRLKQQASKPITVNNDGLWTYDRPTESTVEILTSDDICEIVALHNATVRRLRIELLKEVFARPE